MIKKNTQGITKAGWFGHPIMSAVIALAWLLLQHTTALVHVLSAVALGLLIPRLLHAFLPQQPRIRLGAASKLVLVVLYDIVLSNIQVAKMVLGPLHKIQPAWVQVALDVQNPLAIHLFASIITTTPGTVSAVVDKNAACIWVHALNCTDPLAAAQDMKARYEQALMHIFREDEPQ